MTATNRRSLIASLRKADVQRPRRMAPYALLAVAATLLSFSLHESGWLWWKRLDNWALDKGFRMRGEIDSRKVTELPQTKDFVIVELDYQIPRAVLATLVQKLRFARVVALDLMLADQEAELHPQDKESPVWQRQIKQWRIDDAMLAASMKKADNVLIGIWPERLTLGHYSESQLPAGVKKSVSSSSGGDPTVEWRRPPLNIWNAARWHSHLRVEPDVNDGIVRRVRMEEMTPFSKAPLPSFSLAVARAHSKVPANNYFDSGEDGAMIDYMGGIHTFPDDARIIEPIVINNSDPEEFRGLTVFVGQSNYSSKDIFPTPYGDIPGVQIHAQAAATWLTPNGGLKPVDPVWTILLSLGSCLGVLAPLVRWQFASTSISGAILAVGVVTGCLAGYAWAGIAIPMSVPLFAIVLTYNGAAILEVWRTRKTLGRFIGADQVEQAMHPLSSLELGGKTERATAFFCDLRGYSRLSETLPPERAAALLKAYTTTVTRVVESHGGRPIDYLGDGVFVLFEERHTKGMHALAAADAAIESQQKFAHLAGQWVELASPQSEPLQAAIAIHTGEMLIGLVGDEHHLKPGAVGDAVNVAAHAQSYSKECGYQILATRDAIESMGEAGKAKYRAHACGEFQFKGRQTLVELFGIEARATDTKTLETDATKA